MSQQKVDQHKQEKYNRKKQLKKEKLQRTIYGIAGAVVAIALVGWIGFSVYSKAQTEESVSYTEVNMNAINDYMSELD